MTTDSQNPDEPVAIDPPTYEYSWDFDYGLGPWTTWLAPSVVNEVGGLYERFTRLNAPGAIDPNHFDGIGALRLVAHLSIPVTGSPGVMNLTDAEFQITIRGTDFQANGAKLVVWLCRYVPEEDVFKNYYVGLTVTNWANTGNDIAAQLTDQWQTITVSLSNDPADWTYAGTNNSQQGDWADRYQPVDLDDTLAYTDATLHLVLVSEEPDQAPTGFLDIANITVRTQTPAAGLSGEQPEIFYGLEDQATEGVLAGDPSVNMSSATFSLVGGSTTNGAVTIDPVTGAFTFTPDSDFFGPTDFVGHAGFRYRVTDGTTTVEHRAFLFIGPINDAPTATTVDETVDIAFGQPFSFTLFKGADVDRDERLTYHLVQDSATNGTVTLDATNGRYVFTPAAGFSGSATFSYYVSDGQLDSAPNTVNLTVHPDGSPPTPVTYDQAVDFLIAGDTQAFANHIVQLAQAGNVNAAYHYGTFLGNGRFVPRDAALSAYYLGLAVNHVPDANLQLADRYISGDGVDKDYSAARALLEALPNNATALYRLGVLENLGFGAPRDDARAVELYLQAANLGSADAMYTVGRRYLMAEGVAYSAPDAYFWLAVGLRLNGGPAIGQFDSLLLYNMNQAAVNLTVEQRAALDAAAAGWVPGQEAPVNDAPVAGEEAVTATGQTNVALSGALAEASDTDGNSITYSLVAGSAENGTVTIDAATGAYVFTPATGYDGPASFRYVVTDGQADSVETTISLVFERATSATGDVNALDETETLVVGVGEGLLANDLVSVVGSVIQIDSVNGQPAGVGQAVEGTYGSVTINADGSYSYVVNPGTASLVEGETVTDSFTYTIIDQQNVSATATLTLTISGLGGTVASGSGTITGSEFGDILAGGSGSDIILGLGGDDVIAGGDGATDEIRGGTGDDTFIVTITGDVIIENAGEGVDTVQSSVAVYSLGSEIENLIYTGSDVFEGTGNAGANVIIGGVAADSLSGLDGADTLVGGSGADTLNGGDGVDTVSYATAAEGVAASLRSQTGTDGDANGDVFTGVENLIGSAFDDVLSGGAGTNTLNGGDGVDTADYGAAAAGVTVQLNGGVASNDGDGTADTLVGFENVTGSAFNDLLIGDANANQLSGGQGADTLLGLAGNDVLIGGTGSANTLQGGLGDDQYVISVAGDSLTEFVDEGIDTVETTLAAYTLRNHFENLTFSGNGGFAGTGNALANVITGGASNDVLDGGAGIDTLIGGLGDDTYLVADAADVLVEADGEGTDLIRTTLNAFGLGAGIENLTFAGAGAFTGTGNALANAITGGSGNDTLDGGAGADSLIGGLGDDTYLVDDGADAVVELSGQGYDAVASTANVYTLGTNIEDLTFAGTGGFSGTGNASANVITGGSGDDILDGGAGADRLTGGLGDDTYQVDNAADVVVEADGEGADTVRTTLNALGLGTGVENLTFVGTGAFTGTGNAQDNVLTGAAGDDVLIGGVGADTLHGGAGVDTASYATAAAGVVVSLRSQTGSTGEAAGDVLTGIENLTGSAFDDILSGGAGTNRLTGGAGIDTVDYGAAAAGVTAQLNSGFATNDGDGGSDTLIGFENLTGSAFNDLLIGDASANVLSGGQGADTLLGLAGNDVLIGGSGAANTLQGGLGDDRYVISLAGDSVTEFSGEGVDTVETALAAYVLTNHVENLTFSGTGAFSGTGNGLANVITGAAGDDVLTGGAGADTLHGGSGVDTASYSAAAEGVIVSLRSQTGSAGEAAGDILTGIENLTGSTFDDTLSGGVGANRLSGGAGIDTIDYSAAAAGVTVQLDGGTVTDDGDGGVDTLISIENATGSGFNDLLVGDVNSNQLSGGLGADTLLGLAGNDVLIGGTGFANTLQGGLGDDRYVVSVAGDSLTELADEGTDTIETTLIGYVLGDNFENLTFSGNGGFAGTGNALANVITGGASNDVLDGGAGIDTLIGGLGDDTYLVADAADVLVEADGEGTDLIRTTLNAFGLGAGIENLTFAGAGAFTGTGNALANAITGGSGNDTLDGGAGADSLIGGLGDDTYLVDDGADAVVELSGQGYDAVASTANVYTLGTNIEDLTFAGTGGFSGTGNASANVITGGSGDDILDGGAGADRLTGGLGDDTYQVDNAADVVVEADGEGADTVRTTLNALGLGTGVENLTFVGTGAFTGTGNAQDNVLTGAAGDDVLIGGVGADTLHGGAGVDTASYATAAAGVVVSLRSQTGSTGEAAGDVLTGIENLTGSAFDDILSGGAGTNRLTGGAGIDTVDYSAAAAGVTVRLNSGTATNDGEGGSDVLIGFENVIGSALNDLLIGQAGANVLSGGQGADTLLGLAGNDVLIGGSGAANTLQGGLGDDRYVVSATDSLTEFADEGVDTVETTLAAYTLRNNFENLVFAGAGNFAGTGNTLNNVIDGGAGADVLSGLAGNDTLSGGGGTDRLTGGLGDDSYRVDVVGDTVIELVGEGHDTVISTAGTYVLSANVEDLTFAGTGDFSGTGNALANVITGGSGNDTLDGGAGADRLTGGLGDDTYQVDNAADAVVEADGEGTDLIRTTLNAFGLGAGIENLTFAGTGDFAGTGNALANVIAGGAGNDTLDGGAGADRLTGGLGDDTYQVDDVADVVVEVDGEGTDLIRTTLNTYGLGAGIENLSFAGAGDFAGTGSASANAIAGGSGNDTLDGAGGADRLTGGLGDDIYVVDDAGDVVVEADGEGTDLIRTMLNVHGLDAGVENLTFDGTGGFTGTGNALANAITGGSGNDSLDGGAGADHLTGGLGDDVYQVDETADAVVERIGEGHDTVVSTANAYALDDDLEDLTFAGAGDFSGTGNASANVIIGGAGNDTLAGDGGDDTLRGGAGVDVLTGGAGVDTADYGGAVGAVTTSLATGVTSSDGHGGTDALSGIENLTGSAFNDNLTGDVGNNLLAGGLGDDTLRGGAGMDVLTGGAGVDTADYGGAAAAVTASLATGMAFSDGDGGTDTLSGIENLTGSALGDSLTGDGGNNSLAGDAGDDTLRGGAGVDVLTGGSGVDTADYGAAAGSVTASLATGEASSDGDDGTDSLALIENLVGSDFNDTLIGDAANNALTGGAGDDILRGGAGIDVLSGGSGIDTVDYSSAAAGMRAQLNTRASSNDGDGGTDSFSGIENLTGSAFNDVLIGDGAANVLRGGTGADTLLGLAGNDVLWGGSGALNTLQGGLGDDLYVIEGTDTIIEVVGEGTDTVDARLNTYVLAANVENLVFGGTGSFAGTGNALANVITGGAGADTLRGRGGVDVLNGGAGVDTADYTLAAAGVVARIDQQRATNDGDGATDTYTGIENLIGSNFSDTLIGDDNANVLMGGVGADTLLGLGGNDVLMGGSGGGNNQLQGGQGDDRYILDAFDSCVELSGEGIDTVEARVGSYTLGANVENLMFTGLIGSFVGTGNTLDNVITGGAGNDIVRGMGGNDTIRGGSGTDEVQLRGLLANYVITAEGAGWRIVDSVADRDGSTYVESIERLRFSNNATLTLTYAASGALESVDKAAGEDFGAALASLVSKVSKVPEVQPKAADDDVLPPIKAVGPEILPGVFDDIATADPEMLGRLELQPAADGFLLPTDFEGPQVLPAPIGDGLPDRVDIADRAPMWQLLPGEINPMVIDGPGGLRILQDPAGDFDPFPGPDPWS